MITRYNLVKKNNIKKYLEINIDNSFNVNKKNDEGSIGIIKIYNNDMINHVIKKKMDIKFKKILEMLIKYEEDDSDPSEGLMICLNELDKLHKELINKYKKFLDKKKLELQENKIRVLEKEIKLKLFNIQIMSSRIYPNDYNYIDEDEKESTRRR